MMFLGQFLIIIFSVYWRVSLCEPNSYYPFNYFHNQRINHLQKREPTPHSLSVPNHFLGRPQINQYNPVNGLHSFPQTVSSVIPANHHNHHYQHGSLLQRYFAALNFSALKNLPYSPIFILIACLQGASEVDKLLHGDSDFKNHDSWNSLVNYERATIPESCNFHNLNGQCYSYQVCSENQGRITSYCPNYTKFCCLIYKTCGESSSDMSIYYRNSRYPFADQVQSQCGIEIKKRNSDICSLQITPNYLNIPVLSSMCEGIHLGITGVPGKSYKPLCGYLSNSRFVVDISSVNSVSLFITSNISIPLQWSINIIQVPCSASVEESWPQIDGDVTEGPSFTTSTTALPTTQVPVSSTSSTGTPLNKCGVPNRRTKSQIGDRGQLPLDIVNKLFPENLESNEESDSSLPFSLLGIPETRNMYRASGENPLLTSLEWSAPVLNDSLLYQVAGPPNQLTGRITFGKKTEPHEYPWAVVMYRSGRFHCGASIIGKKHILTAAHCVQRYQNRPSALTLSLGDWNINSNSDGPSVTASISKIAVHPQYSSRTLQNDIAVITLKRSVTFSKNLSPICLPSSDLPLSGKIVTVSGWGRNENNQLQTILMEHSAVAMTTKECNRRWSSFGRLTIIDKMLCMDTQDGDSCKGDSGGPTIMEHPPKSGRYIQVGLVSFGSSSCTDKNLPGVYTKVTKYLKWIEDQMI